MRLLERMRERREDDVLDPYAPADEHPWRAALWLTALAIAFGTAWGLWIWPWIHGVPHWLPPPDSWHALPPAHFVVDGHLGHIYASDRFYVAGPLFPVVMAPVAWLDQVLHLTESYPKQVPHPTSWFVYGPYGLATVLLPLFAVRALATEAGVRRGRLGLQIAALFPLYPVLIVYGHYEDVLAAGLVLLAARELIRERTLRAAVVLSIGIAVKQWAALALPVLLVAAPRGRRLRTLGASLALPATLAGFTLLVDWPHASRALFRAATFPSVGERAPWVPGDVGEMVGTPARLATFVLAIAAAWAIRHRVRSPDAAGAILAALGVTFLGRVLFEPSVYSYYLGPGLVLLLVHEKVARGRLRRTLVVGTAWLWWFEVWPARWWWWVVSYLAFLLVAGPAIGDLGRNARRVREPA